MKSYEISRYRKLIRENNLTVVSLAKRIGVPKSTLYNKLMGDSDVGIVLAKKIKTALGTSEPIEVLFSTDEATPTPAA